MSKKFLVDDIKIRGSDEMTLDHLRKALKANVRVVENWWSEEEMEQDTATTFMAKARHYLSLSPPDHQKSTEKVWFAAVSTVRELYLSCGGIDLQSDHSVKFFFRFALDTLQITRKRVWDLNDCWTKAEAMQQYSENFLPRELAKHITDVESLINELANVDRKKLWNEFNKNFIVESDPDVHVKKESRTIILGGTHYTCDYSASV